MTAGKFMQVFSRQKMVRLGRTAGVTGVGVMVLGALISAVFYTGRSGEAYRFANHFVSELGEVGVSPLAGVFNAGLVIGGLCFTLFMLGAARYIGGWTGAVFGVVGLFTAVSGVLVGVFPMTNLGPHIRVAMNFFNGGMVSIAVFSLIAAFDPRRRFPRWFALPGVVTFSIFFGFLYIVDPVDEGEADALTGMLDKLSNRPDVWPSAILEWLVIGAVVGWVLLVALYLFRVDTGRSTGFDGS